MKEIKLRIPRSHSAAISGGGFRFCRDAFDRCVNLPSGLTECFLNVSKDPAGDEDYRITRPIQRYNFSGPDYTMSSLTRIKGNMLYIETRRHLSQLYSEGYRSVSIMYES